MKNLASIAARSAVYALRPDVFCLQATEVFSEASDEYKAAENMYNGNTDKKFKDLDLADFDLVHALLCLEFPFYNDRCGSLFPKGGVDPASSGKIFSEVGRNASKTQPRFLAKETFDHFVVNRNELAEHFAEKGGKRGCRVPWQAEGEGGSKPTFSSWASVFEVLFSYFRNNVCFP